mgnify:CR=1 FL=1
MRELKDKCVNTVVSTGGGMPVRKDNHELLRDIGKVIYLSAEPESIYERVKDSTNRPLLMCENLRKKIEDMLAIRNPIYNEVANFVVRTDNKKVDEIVSEILTLW